MVWATRMLQINLDESPSRVGLFTDRGCPTFMEWAFGGWYTPAMSRRDVDEWLWQVGNELQRLSEEIVPEREALIEIAKEGLQP